MCIVCAQVVYSIYSYSYQKSGPTGTGYDISRLLLASLLFSPGSGRRHTGSFSPTLPFTRREDVIPHRPI